MFDYDAIAESIAPDQLAEAIGAQQSGSSWICPRGELHQNGDRKPSLSIFREDRRTGIRCHGCDLHGTPVQVFAEVHQCSVAEAARRLVETFNLRATISPRPGSSPIVETYDYLDENGEILFQLVRTDPKGFFQRRPDGNGGWLKNLAGTRKAGAVATTNPGGARKWRDAYNQWFRGADVVVIADKDDAGREHARSVANALQDTAARIRIVQSVAGKDAHDHISAGHSLDDFEEIDLGEADIDEGQRTGLLWTLEDIQREGLAMQGPEVVVPYLAWRGRATLLVGREKLGKSTLMTAAAVAVCCGERFLGAETLQGPVLYLALEEHPEDLAARFCGFGGGCEDPLFGVSRLQDPYTDFKKAVEELYQRVGQNPVLVVVDSLQRYATSLVSDASSSSEWSPVMSFLVDMARTWDTAVVILHHPRKKDDMYRDSSVIGATVDAIICMNDGNGENARKFKGKGRWPIESFSARLVIGDGTVNHYELTSGGDDLDARIIEFVANNPGCSARAVADGVRGRAETILDVINQLLYDEVLVNRGSSSAYQLYVPDDLDGASESDPSVHDERGQVIPFPTQEQGKEEWETVRTKTLDPPGSQPSSPPVQTGNGTEPESEESSHQAGRDDSA
jgi:hypothetical protein